MLIGDVVGDDVDDRADAHRVRLVDERLRIGQRAEERVDGAVVDDVIAAVRQGRDIPRRDPDGVHPEVAEVRQTGAQRRRGRRCRRHPQSAKLRRYTS